MDTNQPPGHSKYWGNVFLSALLLVLDYYACIKHEIPWWTFGACAALCMGWMTPALFVDAFRMYARALHTPPPVALVQAMGAAVGQGGDGSPPGGGATVTARTAAVLPARIIPPPEQNVPRMSWPSPGLAGLAETLRRWNMPGASGFGAVAVVVAVLVVAGLVGPGCATVPNASGSTVTAAAVSGVLREVSASLRSAQVDARREVERATPPPAGASERLEDLAASLRATEALSIALDAYEAATEGAARDALGCRVRTIGGAVVTALVRVVAWLRAAGLPVPAVASLALQGGGLVLDLVAPSCPSASRGPDGGSHAWAVRELREHGVNVEPLPAAWRVRFAPVLAGPAE